MHLIPVSVGKQQSNIHLNSKISSIDAVLTFCALYTSVHILFTIVMFHLRFI